MSLATRLTIWYTLIFSAIVLIAFLTVYAAINTILDVRMDEDLAEDIEELRLLYRQEGLGRLQQELEREVQGGDAEQVFLRLLDTAGNTLYATDMQAWADVKVDPAQLTELSLRDDPILASIAPPSQEFPARTALAALDTGLIIHIGESTEEQREIVAVLARVLAILLCVVIPLVALVGWFIARRAVVGISEVNRISREIHHGDLKRRVAIRHWGKEVEVLAETFNAMIDRIDALVQDMRDLTDNVAHDLRSPLARIRAITESSLFQDENACEYPAAASRIIEECDRLLQMINASLDLAELESGTLRFETGAVNLQDLAEDACELFQPMAEARSINLLCITNGDCKVRGNTQSLQRMLANLLDNALKYTAPNGEVQVQLHRDRQQVCLRVIDSGPGIPAEEQCRVFERFYRGDQSRSQEGCGMGLSYARAVALAHGGSISLNSTPGAGCEFTVSLAQATGPF